MPDLQELHWTNEIRATRMGYAVQTVYLLGPEPRAALDYATPFFIFLFIILYLGIMNDSNKS